MEEVGAFAVSLIHRAVPAGTKAIWALCIYSARHLCLGLVGQCMMLDL